MRPPTQPVPSRLSFLLLGVTVAALSACRTAAPEGAPTSRPATDPAAGQGRVPDEGFLTGAEGARIFHRVMGAGPDTVVVLHGGPGAGIESIRPAVAPLADHFTLVFYDQRGGGRSELPRDTTLLAARYHVQDLEAVRRHFGLDRMKIFAHSFGPLIVARYALAHPHRIDRMVFHGATGPVWEDAVRVARAAGSTASPDTAVSNRAARLLTTLLSGDAADPVATCQAYEATGRRLARLRGEPVTWTGTTCDAPPEAVRYYYRHTAQYSPRTFGRWDFTTGLRHLDAPLLVIAGTRDSLALSLQRAWADAVPHGRLLEVPAAGKGAISERPDLVLPAVTEFLRSTPPPL